MRPANLAARDQLERQLGRRAWQSAAELAQALAVSVPTLHRLLAERGEAVLGMGRARRSRYALRRALRGQAAPLPVVEVDAAGRSQQVGALALLQPQGTLFSLAGSAWPVPAEPASAADGGWDGLPYPLQDMRPQGYLGRQLARAHHALLQVPADPRDWSDEATLHALAQIGDDCSGNLIVGEAAFRRWQAARLAPQAVADGDDTPALAAHYHRLADQAVGAGVAGSSAAGEFPKFPALRRLSGSSTPHVLVKFSGDLGADPSRAVQRWADLLVCEHLALGWAATLPGVVSARSRIVRGAAAGRSFLEVERFDRHGPWGRSPLVSLATLDAVFVGAGIGDWCLLAAALQRQGLLAGDTLAAIQHLWWFGRLIANSDMHTGNLSFRPQPVHTPDGGHQPGPLALAPCYDMLPMRYAPLAGGEVPPVAYAPPLPLPAEAVVWHRACAAALGFWQQAATDTRISAPFRTLCTDNAEALAQVAIHAV